MDKKCAACGREVKSAYIAVPVYNGVKYYHSYCDKPKKICEEKKPHLKKTSSKK